VATTIGFIVSLIITYVNPFIQNEPGNLGARVGMVYGSVSIIAMAFVWLVVPEMKGRSLEEIDELYHAGVPAWRASSYVSTGIGSRITDLETVEGRHTVISAVKPDNDDDAASQTQAPKKSNDEL
jgi:MFS transporter, SP family, sugar:H+ symporter